MTTLIGGGAAAPARSVLPEADLVTPRQIFVIDVAGGDKVPRKGGPGVTRSDLLVVNKTDLAPLVGADLSVMARDAAALRGDRPMVFTSLAADPAATEIATWVRTIRSAVAPARAPGRLM